MNYLRGAFADAKLKYRVNRVVSEAVHRATPASYAQCVMTADEHAQQVLASLREHTTYSHPEVSYKALTVLEHLVSSCNYAFHEALAQYAPLQDKIVQLAVRRVEDDAHRRVQRLCRLTLLEYSRMFADDSALNRLSALAQQFEKRTHKSLLRCLNVQKKRVAFREVQSQDVVMLSPHEGACTSIGVGVKDLAPLKFTKAEVWGCHVCGYMNAPAANRCAACETARVAGNTPPASPNQVSAGAAGTLATAAGTAASTVIADDARVAAGEEEILSGEEPVPPLPCVVVTEAATEAIAATFAPSAGGTGSRAATGTTTAAAAAATAASSPGGGVEAFNGAVVSKGAEAHAGAVEGDGLTGTPAGPTPVVDSNEDPMTGWGRAEAAPTAPREKDARAADAAGVPGVDPIAATAADTEARASSDAI